MGANEYKSSNTTLIAKNVNYASFDSSLIRFVHEP